MNYELAKQLKDAGFPQIAKGRQFKKTADYRTGRLHDVDFTQEFTSTEAYIPTLQELIEACGEDFVDLQKLMGGQWLASAQRIDQDPIEARDSTSIEAVARLWLALNQK